MTSATRALQGRAATPAAQRPAQPLAQRPARRAPARRGGQDARRPARLLARAPLLVAGLGILVGCGGDSFHPPETIPADQAYWALELNHQAVTLSTRAPGKDTLTLVATARTADGTALPPEGLPPVQYVSRDPERIVVRPDGRLQAIQPTGGGEVVAVVATLIANNLKHVDSVLVVAVDNPTPPVLDSFSIHPGPPDSAKTSLGYSFFVNRTPTCFALPQLAQQPFSCRIVLPVTLLDATGAPITPAAVVIRSADRRVLDVTSDGSLAVPLGTSNNGAPEFSGPTTTPLYASATVFGVRRADTLPFRVGWPTLVGTSMTRPSPVVRIGAGGVVWWQTNSNDTVRGPVDITFADPTQVLAADVNHPSVWIFGAFGICPGPLCFNDAGNVLLDGSTSPIIGPFHILRRFPVPGVYDYYSTALGTSGRIIVEDDR